MSLVSPGSTVYGMFPDRLRPYNPITPFTYRDGLTYLQVLESLREWLMESLIPHVDAESAALIKAYDNATAALKAAMDKYQLDIAADREAFEAFTTDARAGIDAALVAANGIEDRVKIIRDDINTRADEVIAMLPEVVVPSGEDDTNAVREAFATLSAKGGGRVTLPAGSYSFVFPLVIPENVNVEGHGQGTTFQYSGSGDFIKMRNESRLIGVNINGNKDTFTLVTLDNVFRCVIRDVTLSGQHLPGNLKPGQVGLRFTGNAGDSQVNDSRFNNLGVGVLTESIMDYLNGCVFSSCQRGVYGKGTGYNAGISVSDTTFVSNAAATIAHVEVKGNANKWWFTNVWMEGCTNGVIIGDETGGPYNFGLVNVAIAASENNIVINSARQSYLANVALEIDANNTPEPLTIHPTRAPDGVATNVTIYTDFDISPDVFPSNWTYIGRDKMKLPPNLYGAVTFHDRVRFQPENPNEPAFKVSGPYGMTTNVFEIGHSGAVNFWMDQYNNVSAKGNINAGENAGFGFAGPGGVSITSGAGVPTSAQNPGSIYIRRDASTQANQRLYVNTGGSNWAPLV